MNGYKHSTGTAVSNAQDARLLHSMLSVKKIDVKYQAPAL